METDLLFTAVKQSEWTKISEERNLKPEFFQDKEFVYTFAGSDAEKIINHNFSAEDETVLLIILDPLRIQAPFQHIEKDGFKFVVIKQSVSMDAIIDKIKLYPDKKGKFSVQVKHFD